ncbi:MAG: aldolase catalytic domain-containing protein [Helicobacter sp.]|nr:aldolase catalytic domain-containing protein [Helicobacteraceae bacterium]MDY3112766.1 aldolase catalytic domain-containing protein [Helicobacter sp.]
MKLLDCTLRDGAYLVEKTFGDSTIKGIIGHLVEAGIDIIEIGFLENSKHLSGKSVFLNPSEAESYLPSDTKGAEFALMADFSRYDFKNLTKCSGKIKNIRLCFFKHERFDALELADRIHALGYKLFIQPVDILGYSDKEILELLEIVNKSGVFAFSIVDTFGSMYLDDLRRIFSLINHNLDSKVALGFHSHNNLQLSSALSQEFLHLCVEREGIVDATINGLGRGAGNTATELIALYANTHLRGSYKIEEILDSIDIYLSPIKARVKWGYSIPYYIAGMHSAHTNNIIYLLEKNAISSKDLMHILGKLDSAKKKRYDYENLEALYLEHLGRRVDDESDFRALGEKLNGREILILAPGGSIFKEKDKILDVIKSRRNLVVINVNFLDSVFKRDFIFISNVKRFDYLNNTREFRECPKILLSSIKQGGENTLLIDINRVLKGGWENLDNSTILLLRLLDNFSVDSINLAGFDGFSELNNYFSDELVRSVEKGKLEALNNEILEMFLDYKKTRKSRAEIRFITESRFDKESK